jgi:hypothetical protein
VNIDIEVAHIVVNNRRRLKAKIFLFNFIPHGFYIVMFFTGLMHITVALNRSKLILQKNNLQILQISRAIHG